MKAPQLIARQARTKEKSSQTAIHWPITRKYVSKEQSPKILALQLVPQIIAEWQFKKEERCMVCWAPIKEGEKFDICPHCGGKAHTDHLMKWLTSRPLNSRVCPRCRSPRNV
ncbi:MAG: hypothetical protein ACFFC7_10650 [Candidatus Hermodarchaeota archaeon]